MAELLARPDIHLLSERSSIGMRFDDIPLELHASELYPTKYDKAAMSEFWSGRKACLALEGDYVQQNYPPEMAAFVFGLRPKFDRSLIQLYTGTITFGQFVRLGEANRQAVLREIETRQAMAAGFAAEAQMNSAAAFGSMLGNVRAQQDRQLAQQQQADRDRAIIQQMNRPTITTCRRDGATQSCSTY